MLGVLAGLLLASLLALYFLGRGYSAQREKIGALQAAMSTAIEANRAQEGTIRELRQANRELLDATAPAPPARSPQSPFR